MKRETRIVLWIVLAVALIAGVVCWQMYKLGKGLRTIQAGAAGEVLVGALSDELVSPGVDGRAPHESEPLLEQYRANPTLDHKRYLLVVTWLHASQMFKAFDANPPSEGEIVSSVSMNSIPPEDRVDGWGNPYCFLAESKHMTFLSSGGKGAPNCKNLRYAAEQAASRATDSRLSREGDLLVAVYERAKDDSTIRTK